MGMILLFGVAVALAYANGANDNFKACGTVYASRTLGYRGALRLATAAQITGSIASVFLAEALLKAFSGKGLVPDTLVADPHFLVSVGLGAAATVGVATVMGMPISTTHALIGGLVGGGLALAPGELIWGNLGRAYFMPLLMSPLLAAFSTMALYPLAGRTRKVLGIEAVSCVCATAPPGAAMETAGGVCMTDTAVPVLSVSPSGDCGQRYSGAVLGVSAQQIADGLHLTSAFALGFARGLNDTPKVLGLLLAAGYLAGPAGKGVLMIVAAAMALGGFLHSRALARTLGERITTMNHGQGLLANAVSSSLVIGASLLGSPVSTTHVSTGAIFGIGRWTGTANWKMVGAIIAAWVVTLPLAAFLAYCMGRMF